MKLHTWHREHVAWALCFLGSVALFFAWDEKTWGWLLTNYAGHTRYSHGLRQSEDAGKSPDYLSDVSLWVAGLGVLLGAESLTRLQAALSVLWLVGFTVWRYAHRRKI